MCVKALCGCRAPFASGCDENAHATNVANINHRLRNGHGHAHTVYDVVDMLVNCAARIHDSVTLTSNGCTTQGNAKQLLLQQSVVGSRRSHKQAYEQRAILKRVTNRRLRRPHVERRISRIKLLVHERSSGVRCCSVF